MKNKKIDITFISLIVTFVSVLTLFFIVIMLSIRISNLEKENLELIIERDFCLTDIQDLKITKDSVSFWSNNSGKYDNYFWVIDKEENWITHKYLNGVEIE